MWYITLGMELLKLLVPIIMKIRANKKPNPEAAKEMVQKISGVVNKP